MKRSLAVVAGLLISWYCTAQGAASFRLQNQYQEPLVNVQVNINGKAYTTGTSGEVTVEAPGDSLRIEANGHHRNVIAVNKIPESGKVELSRDFTWKDVLNPMFYIIHGGLWLILFIVFAETGLFVGFFLPGDSLLFVAGIYSSELIESAFHIDNEFLDLSVLILLIALAGIIGNTLGYWFGKKVGPAMYHWKDRALFKKKYLHQAHEFYEKHGAVAIVGARFLPMVRTFAPIIAGIVDMDRKKFAYYNILGSFLWVTSLVLAGHFLQKWMLEWFGLDLKSKLEYIVITIVFVTTAPVLYKMFFSKKKSPTLEIGKEVVEEQIEKAEDSIDRRFEKDKD